MDEVDVANENTEKAMNNAMKNRKPVSLDIHGSGLCVVCFGTVDAVSCGGKQVIGRFCSIGCRDDYETL